MHALSHMALPLGPTGREVLEDGGSGGVTVVESKHVATWRLLMFSGTLQTRQAAVVAAPTTACAVGRLWG